MDLRKYEITDEQLEQVRNLACRGLICYQPFIFSDNLETGVGYELLNAAEGAGLVYTDSIPENISMTEGVKRHLFDYDNVNEFKKNNQQFRILYESMIELIIKHTGSPEKLTFGDVGSCTGYFPLSFSKRGAKQAVGYDCVDYTDAYEVMNNILDTDATFCNAPYLGETGTIENAEKFDVVTSMAVLVHLSDPLQHLAFLGSITRKALFIWTAITEDEEEMEIKFKSINRYYKDAKFPFCFDVVIISKKLLTQSLKLMGFNEIYKLENKPGGMPEEWFNRHRGYLALRV